MFWSVEKHLNNWRDWYFSKGERTPGVDFILTLRGNKWSLNGNLKREGEMISIKDRTSDMITEKKEEEGEMNRCQEEFYSHTEFCQLLKEKITRESICSKHNLSLSFDDELW